VQLKELAFRTMNQGDPAAEQLKKAVEASQTHGETAGRHVLREVVQHHLRSDLYRY